MSEDIQLGIYTYSITFNPDPSTERKNPVCSFIDGQPLGLHPNRSEAKIAIEKDFFSRTLTEGSRYRHVKTLGVYKLLHFAKLQATGWQTNTFGPDLDMTDMVVYQSEADGSVWTRSLAEFSDGRFVPYETER